MIRARSTENATAKAQTLLQAGCTFIEFGTRRRRSFRAQELVTLALKEEAERSSGPGVFVGTSNVRIIGDSLVHSLLDIFIHAGVLCHEMWP